MTRIAAAAAALVVALAVGFGAGWLVFGGAEEGRSDAEIACEQAGTLPERFFEDDTSIRETLRAGAIATLAQASGVRNDDLDDLDAVGEAGARLHEAMQAFDDEQYAEARQRLLDACADR